MAKDIPKLFSAFLTFFLDKKSTTNGADCVSSIFSYPNYGKVSQSPCRCVLNCLKCQKEKLVNLVRKLFKIISQ